MHNSCKLHRQRACNAMPKGNAGFVPDKTAPCAFVRTGPMLPFVLFFAPQGAGVGPLPEGQCTGKPLKHAGKPLQWLGNDPVDHIHAASIDVHIVCLAF